MACTVAGSSGANLQLLYMCSDTGVLSRDDPVQTIPVPRRCHSQQGDLEARIGSSTASWAASSQRLGLSAAA